HVAALAAFLGLGGVAGLWLALPRAFLGVAWVLFVLAAIVGWIRGRGAPKRGLPARIGIAGRILLLLGLLAGIGTALRGRTPPEGIQAVELAFPLDEGRYLVANGGATTIVNAHLGTLDPDPRFDPWRGQSHAVD